MNTEYYYLQANYRKHFIQARRRRPSVANWGNATALYLAAMMARASTNLFHIDKQTSSIGMIAFGFAGVMLTVGFAINTEYHRCQSQKYRRELETFRPAKNLLLYAMRPSS